MFRELIEHQVYSDVTLVTNDQYQFKVNKFILTSCSSIFKNLLEDYSKNVTIYLTEMHHEELESILQISKFHFGF